MNFFNKENPRIDKMPQTPSTLINSLLNTPTMNKENLTEINFNPNTCDFMPSKQPNKRHVIIDLTVLGNRFRVLDIDLQ